MSEDLGASIKEISKTENLLEGSILVHGFSGNVDPYNKWKEERKTLQKVLSSGNLVSPSLRELDNSEKIRFVVDAPFDKNRLTFHLWKGDSQDGVEYIEEALLALPTTSLEGNVLSEDPAWPGRAISAYNKEGVQIPLKKGILFLSQSRFSEFRSQLELLAHESGLDFVDYVNTYVTILPAETFKDQKSLWSAVRSRIEPARDVSVKIVDTQKQTSSMFDSSGLNFTNTLESKEPVIAEDLGETHIVLASAISAELLQYLEHSYQQEIVWLGTVEANMESNPFNIEFLRDEPSEILEIERLITELDPNNTRKAYIYELSKKYELWKRKLLAKNERALEEKYPDAPREEEIGFGRPAFRSKVFRGKDGLLHVGEVF